MKKSLNSQLSMSISVREKIGIILTHYSSIKLYFLTKKNRFYSDTD